ncbi:glycosyltransferase [Paenibacillus oenotherae]|uniref:Glycosyltransferase n=1 Tax=Paenibacillus oenotherae TaxID=1435645 RepID=A0ABS7D5H3_9BACL|nr:glycosyltransferase [Paenibacillus oenotherae]MBW7475173.1 glycosyltransferase [Paenibacillus oenotherae]
MPSSPRILIGSPVHQKPAILRENLSALLQLNSGSFQADFMFIDDNRDEQSSEMLRLFARIGDRVIVTPSTGLPDEYVRTEETHYWNEGLIWKVAGFKNDLIIHALQQHYDYLFLLDSDLVIQPDTLSRLIQADKDIVSEVFWTRWQPHASPQPQVWLRDEYEQYERQRGERVSDEEAALRYDQFIAQLKQPGLYEVGGLGACTLISRQALLGGVHYGPISNLSFWGEDRHFCVRAAALGFRLYVDTSCPAYHIYRDSDLAGVEAFLSANSAESSAAEGDDCKAAMFRSQAKTLCAPIPISVSVPSHRSSPKLTLTMIVKNESSRYLRQVLTAHRQYIDEAVIIDDGSTDHTPDLCLELLEGVPVRLIRNSDSKFGNEVELRKQQWQETVKSEPQWILNLDADEIFENRFREALPAMLNNSDTDLYCFRLFDFWNDTHYRDDRYWRAHLTYRPFLFRYRPGFPYQWKETPQHCGRFPDNIFQLPHQLSELRLKHLGWANADSRLLKFKRYMELDPEARYGWREQVLSILDKNPRLIEWVE